MFAQCLGIDPMLCDYVSDPIQVVVCIGVDTDAITGVTGTVTGDALHVPASVLRALTRYRAAAVSLITNMSVASALK